MALSTTTDVPKLTPTNGQRGVVLRLRCAVDGTTIDVEDDGHRPFHPEQPNTRRMALIRILKQRAFETATGRSVGVDAKAFAFALWVTGNVPAPAGSTSFDDAHPGLLRHWGKAEDETLSLFVEATNARRARVSHAHPSAMNALVQRTPSFTMEPAPETSPLDAMSVATADPTGLRGPKSARR